MERRNSKVYVEDQQGNIHEYDKIIFASNAENSLKMLGKDASFLENLILSINLKKNIFFILCTNKKRKCRLLG